MLGCKNNRIENIKKLARATAFRLAKEFQEKNKVVESSKKIENKFTIKTSTKLDKGKPPQKTTTIDSRKSNPSPMQMSRTRPLLTSTKKLSTMPSIDPRRKRKKRRKRNEHSLHF